jgi:hypothetical protein
LSGREVEVVIIMSLDYVRAIVEDTRLNQRQKLIGIYFITHDSLSSIKKDLRITSSISDDLDKLINLDLLKVTEEDENGNVAEIIFNMKIDEPISRIISLLIEKDFTLKGMARTKHVVEVWLKLCCSEIIELGIDQAILYEKFNGLNYLTTILTNWHGLKLNTTELVAKYLDDYNLEKATKTKNYYLD